MIWPFTRKSYTLTLYAVESHGIMHNITAMTAIPGFSSRKKAEAASEHWRTFVKAALGGGGQCHNVLWCIVEVS
jgi:hypothetical protein